MSPPPSPPMPFQPRLDILPTCQRALWPELAALTKLGLVLYGGTAIALRLGHRVSVDFDFFTDERLHRDHLLSLFPRLAHSKVLTEERDSITFLVSLDLPEPGLVKVSFFGGLSFGRVGIPEQTADGTLLVASMLDLMATKLKVILQRAEVRDYQDIAALIRSGVSLSAGLGAASCLFGTTFQPAESLKALAFFGDGDLASLKLREKTTLLQAIQDFHQLVPVTLAARSLT